MKKIIILLLIISVLSCKAQEKTQTLKKDTTIEHFDIKHISDINICDLSCKVQEKTQTLKNDTTIEHLDIKHLNDFNKFKKLDKPSNYTNHQRDYTYYYEYEGREVEITTSDRVSEGEGITKDVSFINSPYAYRFIFYPNGNLKATLQQFYDMWIGIDKDYDENGKVIKETNNDLPYKFSIDDLRKKLKAEYKIDIVADYQDKYDGAFIVRRWTGSSQTTNLEKYTPTYQVKLTFKDTGKVLLIIINARTGATISEECINE